MTATEVLEVLGWLEMAAVDVWVDGGWGVDTLVGEETRPHPELDLALDRDELEGARQALDERGFEHDTTSTGTSGAARHARLPWARSGLPPADLRPLGRWMAAALAAAERGAATRRRISAPRASRGATSSLSESCLATPFRIGLRVERGRTNRTFAG